VEAALSMHADQSPAGRQRVAPNCEAWSTFL
jgi:hypothetical protein